MAHSADFKNDLLFYGALHSQTTVNQMLQHIDSKAQLQIKKIESMKTELLRLLPDSILDATGEQIIASNFDLTALISSSKENNRLVTQNSFDEERCSYTSSLVNSQILDSKANHVNRHRWKTPAKKHFDSASKCKNSSGKKTAQFFKSKNYGQGQISSGKKLNWRF